MASQIQVVKQTTGTLPAGWTLGDLRAFVKACDGVADSARGQIKHYEARDQRDTSSTTITVHGAA